MQSLHFVLHYLPQLTTQTIVALCVFVVAFYIKRPFVSVLLKIISHFLSDSLKQIFLTKQTTIFFAAEAVVLTLGAIPLYHAFSYSWIFNLMITVFVISVTLLISEITDALLKYAKEQSDILKAADSIDLTNFIRKMTRAAFFIFAVLILLNQYSQGDIQSSDILKFLGFLTAGISFAARDYISNFFGSLGILFGNHFSKGEKISVDSLEGKVESLGLQQTIIRTRDQSLAYIPNSKLMTTGILINKSRLNYQVVFLEFCISSQIEGSVMHDIFEKIKSYLLAHPSMSKNNTPEIFISGVCNGLFCITLKTLVRHSENKDQVKTQLLPAIRDILKEKNIVFAPEGKQVS